jgi:hypothetical protein
MWKKSPLLQCLTVAFLALGLLCLTNSASATVLVHDTFSDGT